MAPGDSVAWATTQDWEDQRPTITRLYFDENKTLNEVIQIMKREHGFLGT